MGLLSFNYRLGGCLIYMRKCYIKKTHLKRELIETTIYHCLVVNYEVHNIG